MLHFHKMFDTNLASYNVVFVYFNNFNNSIHFNNLETNMDVL